MYPAPAFFDGLKGILLYLLVYTFMNLGAFAVIASLRQRNVIGDELDYIAGLYFRAPTEAALMLIFLLSLAGIPPLAGFYGKYFIFLSLMRAVTMCLRRWRSCTPCSGFTTTCGSGIRYSWRGAGQDSTPDQRGDASGAGRNGFTTVYIGIFPEQFIRMVNWSLGIVQATPVADLIR